MESDDTVRALNTLFEVLHTLVCALAPFLPFLTDHIYRLLTLYIPQHLRDQLEDYRSVHFLRFPEVREELFDEELQRKVHRMQKVIELTRVARERKALALKTPLQTLVVLADISYLDDVRSLEVYVRKELNVRHLILSSDEEKYNVRLSVTPDWPRLGKRLKKSIETIRKALPKLTQDDIKQYIEEKSIVIQGIELQDGDLTVARGIGDPSLQMGFEINMDHDIVIMLDTTVREGFVQEAIARDVASRIQRLRKKAGLVATDDIRMEYRVVDNPESVDFPAVLQDQEDLLRTTLRGTVDEQVSKSSEADQSLDDQVIAEEETVIAKATCVLRLLKLS